MKAGLSICITCVYACVCVCVPSVNGLLGQHYLTLAGADVKEIASGNRVLF